MSAHPQASLWSRGGVRRKCLIPELRPRAPRDAGPTAVVAARDRCASRSWRALRRVAPRRRTTVPCAVCPLRTPTQRSTLSQLSRNSLASHTRRRPPIESWSLERRGCRARVVSSSLEFGFIKAVSGLCANDQKLCLRGTLGSPQTCGVDEPQDCLHTRAPRASALHPIRVRRASSAVHAAVGRVCYPRSTKLLAASRSSEARSFQTAAGTREANVYSEPRAAPTTQIV